MKELVMSDNDNGTFSESRFETSDVRARREPTKYILIRVMALVRHCWKRSR